MPQTPDEQARKAVTLRIAAHVAACWPRLGEPLVTWRGRYCHVAVKLPGRRRPTPFLRLRWQATMDDWGIGICKATTETYSEKSSPGPPGRSPARPSRESTRP